MNLEESDCLVVVNIKKKPVFLLINIVNFCDFLPVRNAKSLTF